MNSRDDLLDRLLKSAAGPPATVAEEIQPALALRVLSAWRTGCLTDEPINVALLFRRGLVFACLLVAASLALNYRALIQNAYDELRIWNSALYYTVMR
jgi:hypothetical protein